MTLLELIGQASKSTIAASFGQKQMSFDTLRSTAMAARSDLECLRGARVLLNLKDPMSMLNSLVVLDGLASAIILTSPTLSGDVLQDLVDLSRADIVLTDGNRSPFTHVFWAETLAELGGFSEQMPPMSSRTEWVMTTSGTTAKPKLVNHSLESLTHHTNRSNKPNVVWGLIYEMSRFAGLQVVLQSLLSGASLMICDSGKGLETQLSELAQAGCTHLSATPTLWRKILMTQGASALKLRQITLGGEIADSNILEAVAAAWPDAHVTHIFASTEAGVAFSVQDGKAGFPVSFLERDGQWVKLRLQDGRLQVQNNEVGGSYLGGGVIHSDGWVDTGDMVERVGDRVEFRGRASGMVNVGGDKVLPEEVETAILQHPEVLICHVYGRKNPITGMLVAADIVLNRSADGAGFPARLKEFLNQRLARYKVPAIIRLKDEIEIVSGGKISRNQK